MSKVTVAIPFYNNASTLSDAILSVLNQTYTEWDLLLIDDGSRDGSLELARTFIGPRVRVQSDGRNRGLIARLNEIAGLASGEYLARMDGDDIMHPRRLELQMQLLMERPEVAVVDSAMFSLNDRGEVVGQRGVEPRLFSLQGLLRGQTLHHATTMGRTAWFRAHPYDPEFYRAEDAELWCRTVESSVFAHIEASLYFVREGRINVRQYVAAQAAVRKIYDCYGSRVFDAATVRQLHRKSRLKAWIYQLAGACGAQGLLTRRRNHPLSPEVHADAVRQLRAATAQAVGRRRTE